MRTTRLLPVAVATTTALLLTGGLAAPAGAAAPGDAPPGDVIWTAGTPRVVTTGLAGPLQMAAGRGGSLHVGQSFSGTLTQVLRDGTRTDVVTAPGEEVTAVSTTARGVVFAQNLGEGPDARADLRLLDRRGGVRTLADLSAHERAANPDGGVRYGFRGMDESCLAQLPPEVPGAFTGEQYSHPYATASLPGSVTVVADAGANALLTVDQRGRVRTLAVLPAAPTTIPPEAAAALGLPECAAGATYWFEAVPTDVEVGPDGLLYVSTLPGGPEDPGFGARGAVWSVDPATGETTPVGSGLLSATNLAVAPDGTVFAAELFGDRVSAFAPGSTAPEPVVELPQPSAVEWVDGELLVATETFGAGTVVAVPLH